MRFLLYHRVLYRHSVKAIGIAALGFDRLANYIDEGRQVRKIFIAAIALVLSSSYAFPQSVSQLASGRYVQSYRAAAVSALSEDPAIVSESGYSQAQLDAPIMTAYAIIGGERSNWISFGQWLAMIHRTGRVKNYEPLFGETDETVFGIKLKIDGYPSFDVIFQLDFGEAYLQEASGVDGASPTAEGVLFLVSGFDPQAMIRGEDFSSNIYRPQKEPRVFISELRNSLRIEDKALSSARGAWGDMSAGSCIAPDESSTILINSGKFSHYGRTGSIIAAANDSEKTYLIMDSGSKIQIAVISKDILNMYDENLRNYDVWKRCDLDMITYGGHSSSEEKRNSTKNKLLGLK